MGSILAAFGSLIIGGAVATTTIVGVVKAQTDEPATSPVSVNASTDDLVGYGSN